MSSKTSLIAGGALFAFSLFYFNPACAATTAGTIELVEGEVKIMRGATGEIVPKVEDKVEEGDTIITGKTGELHIRMEDTGFIGVRPNTELKIEGYRAEGGKDDKSALALLKGTFRSITGWIGKYNRKNYSIKTPTASLGIRGTDHEPLYIPENVKDAEGEPGTYDKVNEGETFIENPRGKIFVKPRQSGFVPFHGRVAPGLLKRVPGFFRRTINEKRIEQRREFFRKQIEQRFKERRKEIQLKRSELQKTAKEKQRAQQTERQEEIKKRQQERAESRKKAAEGEKQRESVRREEMKKRQDDLKQRDRSKAEETRQRQERKREELRERRGGRDQREIEEKRREYRGRHDAEERKERNRGGERREERRRQE